MIDPKKLLKRLDSLRSDEERSNFETRWQAGAEFCNPEDSDIQTTSAKGQRRRVQRITDVGIEARRRFAAGMYAYVIGSGQFFQFRTQNRRLMDVEAVSRWFNEASKVTLDELNNSNFHTEILQGFGELSYIGTTALWTEWHEGGLNFKTQHISRFWIDVDARGWVDTVFVEIPLRPRQIIEEFGVDAVPDDLIRKKDSDDEKTIVQVCMKNPHFEKGSMAQEKRKYISVYILKDCKDHPALRIDGYDEFPFAVGRLYKAKNEKYGRSCYMEASKTISLHNDERATLIRGAKLRADPPWVEASDSNTRHISTNGISRIIYDATALGGAPQQMPITSDVGITETMLEMDKEFIFRAFYVHAFNPLLDQKNMTAYETSERISLGLAEVSPPVNKIQTEYISLVLKRCFQILLDKGRFPPLPTELKGQELKVDFVSKASLALKQIEMYGVMSTIERISLLGQVDPSIYDNFNFDEIARMSAETDNVPNSVLRPTEDVEEKREIRAQQMQQQQMIENAPAVADAAYKASQIEGE